MYLNLFMVSLFGMNGYFFKNILHRRVSKHYNMMNENKGDLSFSPDSRELQVKFSAKISKDKNNFNVIGAYYFCCYWLKLEHDAIICLSEWISHEKSR